MIKKILGWLFLLQIVSLPCHSQDKPHHYKAGEQAPDISVVDIFGDSVRLQDLRGSKVLIVFNRYVSCPLCNYRTHELLSVYDTLKAHGLVILSVYESGKESLTQYTTKEEVPFRMIADPTEKLYHQFKVKKSWFKAFKGLFNRYGEKHSAGKKFFKSNYKRDGHLNRIGADFLVDRNGVIRKAYYGKFVGDHLPVDDILQWTLKE